MAARTVWILPDVLFSDLEFLSLSETEQWRRLRLVSDALRSGDVDYLKGIHWVSLLDPADLTEGSVH